jgi:hypothetical protein
MLAILKPDKKIRLRAAQRVVSATHKKAARCSASINIWISPITTARGCIYREPGRPSATNSAGTGKVDG